MKAATFACLAVVFGVPPPTPASKPAPTSTRTGIFVDDFATASTDFIAITKAIEAAAAMGGGDVIFGARAYDIDETVTLQRRAKISLIGQGRQRTVLIFRKTKTGIRISESDHMRIANMTLRGTEDGDRAIDHLIEVDDGVYDSEFSHLELTWARLSGLRFSATSPGARTLVQDNYFHDINTPKMTGDGFGALVGSYRQMQITGNTFENISNNSREHAAYMVGCSDVVITHNQFIGIHSRLHFWGRPCQRVVVSDNIFSGQDQNVFNEIEDGLVAHNVFRNCSIKLNSDHLTFTGNVLSLTVAKTLIIGLGGADDISVTANNFQLGNEHLTTGIFLTSAATKNWFIASNSFTGHGQAIRINGDHHTVVNNRIHRAAGNPAIVVESGEENWVVDNYVFTENGAKAIVDASGRKNHILRNTLNE